MLSLKLAKSRQASMERMAQVNYDYLVEKMTDYYTLVDKGKNELPPFLKAKLAVENKKAAGHLDVLNQFKPGFCFN